MSTNQKTELERYPKYKRNYLKAFERMLEQYDEPPDWKSAEEVMNWWIGDKK